MRRVIIATEFTTRPGIYNTSITKTIPEAIKALENLIAVQSSDGNWNYGPYMQGLGNGLIVALSVLTGEEPKFLGVPVGGWLEDTPKATASSTSFESYIPAMKNILSRAKKAYASSPVELQDAYKVVCQSMKDDPEYAWAWHCNVAMTAYDAGATHEKANEWAAVFMKNAFDVDTKDMIKDRTCIASDEKVDTINEAVSVFRKVGITGFKTPKFTKAKNVKMVAIEGHFFIKIESKTEGLVFQALKPGSENYSYVKLTRPIKDINKFLSKLVSLQGFSSYHDRIKEYLNA